MPTLTPAALAFSEAVIEVFRVNGLALEAGDVLTKPAGLSSARWQVLGVIEHQPAPVSNVARMMGLTRQSVQQTADALAREGLVEYTPNPHHRTAKLISLTPAGKKALRKVLVRHRAWADRLGKKIGLSNLRTTVEGLRQVRAALEEDA